MLGASTSMPSSAFQIAYRTGLVLYIGYSFGWQLSIFFFKLKINIYPIFRAKMDIYVTRSKDRGGYVWGTLLPSVTDPLLQGLWRSAVGYCWVWSVVWVLQNQLSE